MSSTASDAWRRSIQLNDEFLEKLESRKHELEMTQRAARTAFHAAQADLEAVTAQVDDIVAQYNILRTKNVTMRRELSSLMFRRIPLEILRMVFVEAILCFERKDKWPVPPYESLKEGIRAPFALAAVCSEWRNLALHTPQLWAFISIPLKNRSLPPHAIHRVEQLLERSKHVALDIYLPWRTDDELAWAPNHDTQESRLLGFLGKHCMRWRRFELHVASGALSLDSMSLFRGATPCLEEFYIAGQNLDDIISWTVSFPKFLPFCPKMRYFRSDYSNILISPSNSALGWIEHLELYADVPFATVWEILQLAASSLRRLDLQSPQKSEELPQTLPSRLNFPRLEELTVLNQTATMLAATAAHVFFPILATLEVPVESLATLLPVWEQSSNKVTTLNLLVEDSNRLGPEDAQNLRLYTNVVRLVLCDECILSGDFLLALSTRGPDGQWIMPTLQSIVFWKKIVLEDADAEALVGFLRARQDAHAQGGPDAPCRVEDVVFEDAQVPDWLVSQVHHILESAL